MLHSLLRQHRLAGMTRPDVLGLLGPPDERIQSLSSFQPGDRVWLYYLGTYTKLSADEDLLVLEFGAGDAVARHYLSEG